MWFTCRHPVPSEKKLPMPDSAELEQKIIDAIYRGACDPTELERAIELIGQYFDSSGASLGEFDQVNPEAQFTVGVGITDAAFLRSYARYADFDPAPMKFAALQTGTATTTDRIFTPEFLRTCMFLNEFFRPYGIEGTLGAPLLSAAGRFAIIGMHQGTGQDSFDDDHIIRLERLTPHLARALQIRRVFLQSQTRHELLESIVNRNTAGIIAISAEGPSLFVYAAARAIANARDGISLDRQGRLLPADHAAAKRLAALQSDVLRGGAGGLIYIKRPSDRPAYVALVAPLPSTEDILQRTRRGILIVIHDPSRRIVSTVQRLAHVLQVRLGAAKVVEALLAGIELKDYSEREGISMNTVKFHLKTAFERTGSRSQADLARRALLAINDLGAYFADS
jgi:GAF domain-containing protein